MNEIVGRRIHLKKQLNEELEEDGFLYNYCKTRLETLKQILVCILGHQFDMEQI